MLILTGMRALRNVTIVVLFVSTALVLLGSLSQESFAVPIESNGSGGGNWNLGGSWNGGVVPSDSDSITIKRGDTVTITDSRTISSVGSITIESGGTLNIAVTGSLTNQGMITLTGGGGIFSGLFTNDGTLGNDGTITFTFCWWGCSSFF